MAKDSSPDVIVIGGGVIGLAVARALALHGADSICLIERSRLGNEASFAAAGMLAPQAEADALDDFFTLACRSRDLYSSFAEALREETGVDVELDTTGALYLALNDHDLEEIQARFEWQSRAGLEVEKLTATEARELEPSINSAVLAALCFPRDVQVENRRLLSALANSVAKLGVLIATETSVESLRIDRNRVAGVQTTRGFLHCSSVIIAAGTWTGLIRCPDKQLVQIQPICGQMVCLDAKPQLTRHVIYSPRGYIVPRKDGRLLSGSTGLIDVEISFAKQVTAGGIGTILAHALEISPTVSSLRIVDTWAGLRPRAADGLPVLGPCGEIEGLFYATGHYRNGILLAPLTAELISEAIITGVTSPLLAPFSPDRFSSQPVASV